MMVNKSRTQSDRALYEAWLAGFRNGWEYGRAKHWPIKWIMYDLFQEWMRGRDGRRKQ